jgi:hypothetical protein
MDTAFAKNSPNNDPVKWIRTQHSTWALTGPGSELRKYDDWLFAPSLRILHMPASPRELRGWAGGACRVQFHKSDGHPDSVPGTVG